MKRFGAKLEGRLLRGVGGVEKVGGVARKKFGSRWNATLPWCTCARRLLVLGRSPVAGLTARRVVALRSGAAGLDLDDKAVGERLESLCCNAEAGEHPLDFGSVAVRLIFRRAFD